MRKLILLFCFFCVAQLATAQAIYFTFSSITAPPYVCQADSFQATLSGLFVDTGFRIDSVSTFENAGTLYMQLFISHGGFAQAMPKPFQRSVKFKSPQPGQYTILAQGFFAGQVHRQISTPLNVCNGSLLSITNQTEVTPELIYFPNPAAALLTIQLNESKAGSAFSVSDISGRTLLKQEMQPDQERATLRVSELPAGLYFITLETKTSKTVRKFIKN